MTASGHLQSVALLVTQQAPTFPSGPLMLIGGIIAVVRRKQVIGGWLFFFFWEVVAGFAATAAYMDWPRLAPSAWTDQFKYLLFMVTTMPRLAILIAIAGIGVMLIRTYEWRWLVVLRYALIMHTVLGLVSVQVDIFYFPARTSLDTMTLIFPVVYTVYFYVSTRVKSVFHDRVWNHMPVGVEAM